MEVEGPELEDVVGSGVGRGAALEDLDQDLAWIRSAQRGDHRAFNRLVLKWEQKIYNLVLRTVNDREEAAEVTQEVFLSVFRSLSRFRGDARFSTWLYRVAVNHCLTRLRRRPPPTQPFEELPETSTKVFSRQDQEAQIYQRERRRRVLDSLVALSPQQRIVVELKVYQEETFQEISRILGLPESTVKSRFYSALEILKSRLGGLEQSTI
jgi:RNA polymerase sigma-70 factor (ECF subfamily)